MMMAQVFLYRARNRQGKIVKGNISAVSNAAAIAMLRSRSLFVTEIKPARQPVWKKKFNLYQRRVSPLDLAVFCRQFATMNSCGVPIIQCLNIMARQTENKRLALAIENMVIMLGNGQSLADAVRCYPGVFPPIFISMLEAGESGGALNSVAERLALHFEKEHSLREKVKTALIYPALVVTVAVAAVAVLLCFVLPSFADILAESAADLPLSTKIVIAGSKLVLGYWYLLALVVVTAGMTFRRLLATRRGRALFDAINLRLPVCAGLIKGMVLSRFTRMLGTLLAGGVPLLQAMDVVAKVVTVTQFKKAVIDAAEWVREGQSITGPLLKSKVFPPMVTQMIAVGEETGQLALMLEKLADFYDREVDETAARLSSMIEPVLIVGLGTVVGFIILSILMPVFSIIGSVD